MRTLELFSGTASFSKAARARGHETFTVDIDPRFKPDLCADVGKLTVADLPSPVDVVWASPPCTCFSLANIRNNWDGLLPLNDAAMKALHLVRHTIKLLRDIALRFWFVENPRAALRRFAIMKPLTRRTVTYCQYGYDFQKPTDIWTNCDAWMPRLACKPGDVCHKPTRVRLGKSALKRAVVPEALCTEILIACEKALEPD